MCAYVLFRLQLVIVAAPLVKCWQIGHMARGTAFFNHVGLYSQWQCIS
jgi:hypothetical protein